jgi:hypothetical protein
MKKKNTGIIVPIIWTLVTGIWIVTVCVNIIYGDIQGIQFVLQCVCVLLSGAAAVANFITYKRGNNSEGRRQ